MDIKNTKNMKRILFACLLCCGLAVTLAACSDDDEKKSGEDTEELDEQRLAQREALATVLTTLTGQPFSDTADIDFEGQTYTPQYGTVRDAANPLERSILVRNAESAEGYFRTLAGAGATLITETNDGCVLDLTALDCHSTGKRQNLGTLTFHREGNGDCVAYADVHIDCIPELRRICYKTQAQWGDNAGFESPCTWGDVYVNNGKYYICVRESQGYNSDGALVCMENGRGTNTTDPIGDGVKGIWHPEHVGTTQDIVDFLILCADEGYATQKQRIVKQYPGKVFPLPMTLGYLWNPDKMFTVGGADEGFGSTHTGYSHWTGHDTPVIICRDGTEGNYVGLFQGWYRRFHYVQIDARNPWDRGATERLYQFKNTQISSLEAMLVSKYLYTACCVHFTDRVPGGFALVDI